MLQTDELNNKKKTPSP